MIRSRAGVGGLALLGLACLGHGLWIPAKAVLAQVLFERAWERTRAGARSVPPWPWADTHPVARLRAPDHGADLIVLAGSTGRTMAFGPGHHAGSAPPGSGGNSVIAGHRDTHFAFLERLRPGDSVWLETSAGADLEYVVEHAEVVHERDTAALLPTDAARLTLVTCWPFDAVLPGGPLRYVVRARRAL